MTSDASQEISGFSRFSRRALLRNGLLAGLGSATIIAASGPLAGKARADDSAPASADTPAATAPEQHGWGWCNLCQGMFYTLSPGTFPWGVCPFRADANQHASVSDYTSSDYGFYYNAVGTDWQQGWYWCRNCQGMFWAGSGTSTGACPYYVGLAPHDGSASSAYVAYLGPDSGTGQGGWRYCRNCSGMFWSTNPMAVCPINGGYNAVTGIYTPHDPSGSSNYYIPSSGHLDLGPQIVV
jgi:hypothetical protein